MEGEVFSQARFERALNIAKDIMDNWQATNSFDYTVRATDTVGGESIADLRKQYFTVGVGAKVRD